MKVLRSALLYDKQGWIDGSPDGGRGRLKPGPPDPFKRYDSGHPTIYESMAIDTYFQRVF